MSAVLRAITIGDRRNPSTDPRFAMILLAEIADRALSPAVNDPGTAIAVLTIQSELFHLWGGARRRAESGGVVFDRVSVPDIAAADLVTDAFLPIARDGAGMVEVGIWLQKTLLTIHRHGDRDLRRAAENFRDQALALADCALVLEEHRETVRGIFPQSG